MNKVFYYHGKQALLDILDYKIVKSKRMDNSLNELRKTYINNIAPKLPINADLLMKKYRISEGKQLGEKLKIIEKEWVENNFKISDQQVENIINN